MASPETASPNLTDEVIRLRTDAARNGRRAPGRDQLAAQLAVSPHQIRRVLAALDHHPKRTRKPTKRTPPKRTNTQATVLKLPTRTMPPADPFPAVSGDLTDSLPAPAGDIPQFGDGLVVSGHASPSPAHPPEAHQHRTSPPHQDTRHPGTAERTNTHQLVHQPTPQLVHQKTPIHRLWLVLLALPAVVAVWGGWVGLGGLAGFGPVTLLPGIADHFQVNLAVTLPTGMELYAVIGLRVWISDHTRAPRTRRFAMWSSITALVVGCLGQVAYHVLSAATVHSNTPMIITVCVSCIPVVLLGTGAALFHLMGEDARHPEGTPS
jgi:hypothetical protein